MPKTNIKEKRMKIAIPVNDKSMEENVCPSFGRTPYFLIYETETKDYDFMENSAALSQGGAGIKAAQFVADQGTQALITPRCGQNAADVIQASGIKIYKTVNESIEDNINAFIDGKLSLLNEIHAGFHNHGEKI